MRRFLYLLLLVLIPFCSFAKKNKIPKKIAVLTFDDAVKSHYTIVAPLLKKYEFGATFFICEYPGVFSNKKYSMTWEQISELNKMGFEIGNHTRNHKHVTCMKRPREFVDQLEYIEDKCAAYNIPKPVSFAYPAYHTSAMAFDVLKKKGYKFARVGGSEFLISDSVHNVLAIPSFSTSRDSEKDIKKALSKVKRGKIIVFTIHGVPDLAHPNVSTSPELFEKFLKILKRKHFKVISMRDLEKYLPADKMVN